MLAWTEVRTTQMHMNDMMQHIVSRLLKHLETFVTAPASRSHLRHDTYASFGLCVRRLGRKEILC